MRNHSSFALKSLSVVFLMGLAFVCLVSAADTAPAWKVQVAGVRIVAPAPEGKSNLRAFNWSPGETVSLLLTAPQGNIVGLVREDSKISSFTDDKGTDLMTHNNYGNSTFSTWFSSDLGGEKSVVIEADASGQPAKGATQFNVSGKVVLQTASQTKQLTAENVELKLGSQFNLGDLKFTITGVQLHGKEFGVTLEAKQDLANISHLDFYDVSGAKIESHRVSSSSWGVAGSTTVTWEFNLQKQVDKAKIAAAVWSDLKTTEVPVSVKAGLGL